MSQTTGFFEVDLQGMQSANLDARGLSSTDKYIRQKETFQPGGMYAFKILLPNQKSFDFYRKKGTLPYAPVNHGWFTHPTRIKTLDDGTQRLSRLFHISPKSIGEFDPLDSYLEENVASLPGYLGAPETEINEVLRIFRSLYTNSNPKFAHIGSPSAKQTTSLLKKVEKEFPAILA